MTAPWTPAHVREACARCYELLAVLIRAGLEGELVGEVFRATPLIVYGIMRSDEAAFRRAVDLAGFDGEAEVYAVRSTAAMVAELERQRREAAMAAAFNCAATLRDGEALAVKPPL